MFDEIKFVEATRKLVDCDYALGDTSKGYDCLSMLYAVYGDKLPVEWNGWTLENYAERWKKGEGRKEFIEFLSGLGISVSVNFMQKGDILIFPDGPGIYLGNDQLIRIFAGEICGGKVYPMKLSKQMTIDVRRFI